MAEPTRMHLRLVRSEIGGTRRQRETLRALGLRRRGQESEIERTASTLGMVRKVAHLVEVSPVEES